MSEIKKDSGDAAAALAGKYLTLVLAGEEYGLPILKVQEIIGMMAITRVPRTPKFVRGVINLRGKVIPVIDLRLKFDIDSKDDSETTCIIVVQVSGVDKSGDVTLGIIVDEVSEVVDVAAKQIDNTPALGASVDTEFIMGMGKIGDKVVMLLDLDKAFSKDEFAAVKGTPAETAAA